MLPKVVLQQFVSPFRFEREGRVCQGTNYQGQLYAQVQSFPTRDRMQAYELGYALMRRGEAVLITVSDRHYTVWTVLEPATVSLCPSRLPMSYA